MARRLEVGAAHILHPPLVVILLTLHRRLETRQAPPESETPAVEPLVEGLPVGRMEGTSVVEHKEEAHLTLLLPKALLMLPRPPLLLYHRLQWQRLQPLTYLELGPPLLVYLHPPHPRNWHKLLQFLEGAVGNPR